MILVLSSGERPERPHRQSGQGVEVGKTLACLEWLLPGELQRLVVAFFPADRMTRLMPACRTGTWKFSNRPSGLWAAFR